MFLGFNLLKEGCKLPRGTRVLLQVRCERFRFSTFRSANPAEAVVRCGGHGAPRCRGGSCGVRRIASVRWRGGDGEEALDLVELADALVLKQLDFK